MNGRIWCSQNEENGIPDDHHLLVIRFLKLLAQMLRRVLIITAEDLPGCAGNTIRRLHQTGTIGVLSYRDEERANRLLGTGFIDSHALRLSDLDY